ncbi:putative nucleic acid-binding protein [Sediminihabitans luteus]|uniref:Ribonuclease VapC n=1 Tax=Sediminihabitans luteus TaxID=1138585 RepID=A0A2M9D0L7_9CELL|nr:type II toxin-antitoxin system VapC family toxin [Sediminihabitans luteus]PJJ77744.1 putative nucleic acid-binding protein [Sediminihabitans luteus]GIJ00029.1 hypothetical protein Slu03_24060 [Sediminihabitans luteus]
MSRLVLDASAAVSTLVPGLLRDRTLAAIAGHDLVAPALVDTEVLSALARLERAGAITAAEAERAVEAWAIVPCDRLETSSLVPEIWRLHTTLRVADAHYVALARALGAPLLTADARLARAPLHDVTVVAVR